MEKKQTVVARPSGEAKAWTVNQLKDAIRTHREASLDTRFSAETRRDAALLAITYNSILEHRLNIPRRRYERQPA